MSAPNTPEATLGWRSRATATKYSNADALYQSDHFSIFPLQCYHTEFYSCGKPV